MAKFDVTVTRTVTEVMSFTVSAKDAESAEEKARIRVEGDGEKEGKFKADDMSEEVEEFEYDVSEA